MSKLILATSVVTALALAGSAPSMAADLVVQTPADVAPVAETGDWYVSLFAGGVWTNTVKTDFYDDQYSVNFDPGYTLGVAVGTHVFDNLRGEVELSYGRVEATEYSDSEGSPFAPAEGSLSTIYLLGNLWYELDAGSNVKPYIGGGIGAGYATADTFFDGDEYGYGPGGVGFAYQLGAGVQFGLTDSIAVDVGYRFKGIVGIDFDDNDGDGVYKDGNVNSHVLQAGLTFKF